LPGVVEEHRNLTLIRGRPSKGVLSVAGKLLLGGNAGIDDQEPFPQDGGQIIEHASHRVLAARAKPGAAYQAHTHPLNHHDRGQGRHDIGPHGPACPMAVAFACQGQARARPQTSNGRRVDGVDLAMFTA
jgi:hypothetical protein